MPIVKSRKTAVAWNKNLPCALYVLSGPGPPTRYGTMVPLLLVHGLGVAPPLPLLLLGLGVPHFPPPLVRKAAICVVVSGI